MGVCLKLCVIQNSSCETKEDADGLFQGLKGTSLRPPVSVIWWHKNKQTLNCFIKCFFKKKIYLAMPDSMKERNQSFNSKKQTGVCLLD